MTVAQLMMFLSGFNPDLPVCIDCGEFGVNPMTEPPKLGEWEAAWSSLPPHPDKARYEGKQACILQE